MKQYFAFILILTGVTFSYCNSPGNNHSTSVAATDTAVSSEARVPQDTVKPDTTTATATTDCSQLLVAFVRSSSFKRDGIAQNNIYALVESVKGDVVTVKVFYKVENSSFTVGWLNLDIKSIKLTDFTNDPEEPETLTFDEKALDQILSNCEFHDTK